jgi:ribose 5-phosphate isomerase RpiB
MRIGIAADPVKTFIAAGFSGAERHRRRLAKIEALEREVKTS